MKSVAEGQGRAASSNAPTSEDDSQGQVNWGAGRWVG